MDTNKLDACWASAKATIQELVLEHTNPLSPHPGNRLFEDSIRVINDAKTYNDRIGPGNYWDLLVYNKDATPEKILMMLIHIAFFDERDEFEKLIVAILESNRKNELLDFINQNQGAKLQMPW